MVNRLLGLILSCASRASFQPRECPSQRCARRLDRIRSARGNLEAGCAIVASRLAPRSRNRPHTLYVLGEGRAVPSRVRDRKDFPKYRYRYSFGLSWFRDQIFPENIRGLQGRPGPTTRRTRGKFDRSTPYPKRGRSEIVVGIVPCLPLGMSANTLDFQCLVVGSIWTPHRAAAWPPPSTNTALSPVSGCSRPRGLNGR